MRCGFWELLFHLPPLFNSNLTRTFAPLLSHVLTLVIPLTFVAVRCPVHRDNSNSYHLHAVLTRVKKAGDHLKWSRLANGWLKSTVANTPFLLLLLLILLLLFLLLRPSLLLLFSRLHQSQISISCFSAIPRSLSIYSRSHFLIYLNFSNVCLLPFLLSTLPIPRPRIIFSASPILYIKW